MEVTGAVVVVTGASSGIGRATALALKRAGSDVVAVGRNAAALNQLIDAGIVPFVADVSEPAHPPALVEMATSRFGRLDAVVANAGVGYAGGFARMPLDRLDELIDVDLRAPLHLARAATPVMLEQGRGALVFVSSIAGAVPVPGEAAYSLAKHGLEAFADAIRPELRSGGVTVTVVRPGVVRTAFFARRGLPYDRRFPRPIPPERVADAIVDALRTGRHHVTMPRWLAMPAALRRHARPVYDRMARGSGSSVER